MEYGRKLWCDASASVDIGGEHEEEVNSAIVKPQTWIVGHINFEM